MLHRLIDLLLPRHCLVCGAELERVESVVCLGCLLKAPLMDNGDWTDNSLCRMFWHLFPVERAASMFRYYKGSPWRRLVTAGKYYGRRDVLIEMGRMMGEHFQRLGFFDGIDLIVPMPTTRWRRLVRGYNQAEVLACGVGEVTGLPVVTDAVVRRGSWRSQTTRNRYERLQSLRGVFQLRRSEQLAGRHVLLLDDVCTLGASLTSLGETMAKVPDVRLSVLTLMRTHS